MNSINREPGNRCKASCTENPIYPEHGVGRTAWVPDGHGLQHKDSHGEGLGRKRAKAGPESPRPKEGLAGLGLRVVLTIND